MVALDNLKFNVLKIFGNLYRVMNLQSEELQLIKWQGLPWKSKHLRKYFLDGVIKIDEWARFYHIEAYCMYGQVWTGVMEPEEGKQSEAAGVSGLLAK